MLPERVYLLLESVVGESIVFTRKGREVAAFSYDWAWSKVDQTVERVRSTQKIAYERILSAKQDSVSLLLNAKTLALTQAENVYRKLTFTSKIKKE